jgi:predicted membrane chloride channel (bestrophin family)
MCEARSTLSSPEARRWAHGERSEWEETMRIPIHIAYLLRKSLHSQSKRLRTPISAAQENKLLGSVDSFMGGYYGMRKFLTTPVPFPLIQMARTFVFLYVFTVPFVLLSDTSSNFAHCGKCNRRRAAPALASTLLSHPHTHMSPKTQRRSFS